MMRSTSGRTGSAPSRRGLIARRPRLVLRSYTRAEEIARAKARVGLAALLRDALMEGQVDAQEQLSSSQVRPASPTDLLRLEAGLLALKAGKAL
jgi:hypothetical protein